MRRLSICWLGLFSICGFAGAQDDALKPKAQDTQPVVTAVEGGGVVQLTGKGFSSHVIVRANPDRVTIDYAKADIDFLPIPTGPCKETFRARFAGKGRPSEIRFDAGSAHYSIMSSNGQVTLLQNGTVIETDQLQADWITCELAFTGMSLKVRLNGLDVSASPASEPPRRIEVGCFSTHLGSQQEVEVQDVTFATTAVMIATPVRIAEANSHFSNGIGATAIYKICQGAIVNIKGASDRGDSWSGTGFMIDSNLLVTCAHIVKDASTLQFTALGGAQIDARIASIRVDPDADCAVIRLVGEKSLGMGQLAIQPALPEVGESVYAIGDPLGEDALNGTMSDGIISGHRQSDDGLTPVLQFTCPVTHGNSGGPLLNIRGEVVGIVTSSVVNGSSGISPANLNFAVPSSEILKTIAMPEP